MWARGLALVGEAHKADAGGQRQPPGQCDIAVELRVVPADGRYQAVQPQRIKCRRDILVTIREVGGFSSRRAAEARRAGNRLQENRYDPSIPFDETGQPGKT